MRINQAIALQNARESERNFKAGNKLNLNHKNGMDLAKVLYPNQAVKTLAISKHRLVNDKCKLWSVAQILLICHELMVDPCFLLDFPSIHDSDYTRLVLDKNVDN
jgi:hypothetical protein